jgi:hypothetical protein
VTKTAYPLFPYPCCLHVCLGLQMYLVPGCFCICLRVNFIVQTVRLSLTQSRLKTLSPYNSGIHLQAYAAEIGHMHLLLTVRDPCMEQSCLLCVFTGVSLFLSSWIFQRRPPFVAGQDQSAAYQPNNLAGGYTL